MKNENLTLRVKGPDGNVLEMDFQMVKEASMAIAAITHDLRQQILVLLEEHGRLPVNQIQSRLQLNQAVTSQHLSILRKYHIVRTSKEGKQVFYSLNHEQLQHVLTCLINVLPADY